MRKHRRRSARSAARQRTAHGNARDRVCRLAILLAVVGVYGVMAFVVSVARARSASASRSVHPGRNSLADPSRDHRDARLRRRDCPAPSVWLFGSLIGSQLFGVAADRLADHRGSGLTDRTGRVRRERTAGSARDRDRSHPCAAPEKATDFRSLSLELLGRREIARSPRTMAPSTTGARSWGDARRIQRVTSIARSASAWTCAEIPSNENNLWRFWPNSDTWSLLREPVQEHIHLGRRPQVMNALVLASRRYKSSLDLGVKRR